MQEPIAFFRCVVLATIVAIQFAPNSLGETYQLQSERQPGVVDLVEATLEVGGDVRIAAEGKEQRVKVSVGANFVYEEKTLLLPVDVGGPASSIRYYRTADGEVKAEDDRYRPTLRKDRRLIAVRTDGADVTVFSPQGPLILDELDLVDVLGNSLLLDRLLPIESVTPGNPWKHSDDLMAALLGLDSITASNVQSELTEVNAGIARFEMSGQIDGREGGTKTEVELKGKYHFDLNSKRVIWFGLLVAQDRSTDHVEGGLDVVARLQMKITPNTPSEHLSAAAMAGFSPDLTDQLMRLEYESAVGGWRLAMDRRWLVVGERQGRAVLQFLDRGDRLAQCQVSPSATANTTQVTLAAFQEDVAGALGGKFKAFVNASQRHSEADYRVYRVVAEGETEGVPMQWIYYLVTDSHGHQAAVAFVLEKKLLDAFGQADGELVATLRLAEPKVAANPETDPQ